MHWRTETVFALLLAVVLTVAGAGALYFMSTMDVHPDPAAVPLTPGVHAARYSNAIDESRRLAHALLLDDNLPGLSVAVAPPPTAARSRSSRSPSSAS